MRFEWDPKKERLNVLKHGVGFDLAQRVWDDFFHLLVLDRIEHGEQRWHAIGLVGAVTVLVVHTYPEEANGDRIRIVGARKATPHERKRYEREAL